MDNKVGMEIGDRIHTPDNLVQMQNIIGGWGKVLDAFKNC